MPKSYFVQIGFTLDPPSDKDTYRYPGEALEPGLEPGRCQYCGAHLSKRRAGQGITVVACPIHNLGYDPGTPQHAQI